MNDFIITYKEDTTFDDITAIENYIRFEMDGEAEFNGVETKCSIDWGTSRRDLANLKGKLNTVKNVVEDVEADDDSSDSEN